MSQSSHDLQQGDLIAYLEGVTPAPLTQLIATDPGLLAEATTLQYLEAICSAALFRASCPSGETLLLAVNGLLDRETMHQLTDHLRVCELCRADYAMISDVSLPTATSPTTPRHTLRDYIQQAAQELIAILQPPPIPTLVLRGTNQHDVVYHAGEYQIILTIAPPLVAESTRHIEGQITLHHDPTHVPAGASVQLLGEGHVSHSDHVDEFGYFALDNVESGSYELRIALDPKIIVIRDLTIA